MALFDLILIIILGGFVLFGLWFGFIHTLGSLLGIVVGAFVAGHYYSGFADWGSFIWGGGDLGYVSKGEMVEEFDKASFALDVGEVSGIVETGYGFHIIKVFDRQEEYIQEFDEVKESINTYLLNLHKSKKREDFILSLIEEASIEYFTDVEGTLNDSTDTGTEDNTDTGIE